MKEGSRLFSLKKARKNKIDMLVTFKERDNIRAKRRSQTWKRHNLGVGKPNAWCSKCKQPMNKKIHDEQIKNKRENAPICVACIMGVPRKIR